MLHMLLNLYNANAETKAKNTSFYKAEWQSHVNKPLTPDGKTSGKRKYRHKRKQNTEFQ